MEKSKIKVVFMGTPDFAVGSLESIHKAGYSVEAVITQKDKRRGRGKKLKYTPVKEKALELGLEVYQPENINSDESKAILEDISPDFIVVVAYGQILTSDILNIPKYGSYNVHASLLPKYRGAAPINWVIIDGEDKTGVTIMEMEKGLDTGDMVLKRSIDIDIEDTTEDIHDSLAKLGAELIVEALESIYSGSSETIAQDHSKSTYASMLTKEMGRIDWNSDGRDIVNLIRGLKPWPSAYTMYNEDMVKIHKAKVDDSEFDGVNGEIVRVTQDKVYVKIKEGSLIIEELQFPGKRKMETGEYLKGNTIELGIVLE